MIATPREKELDGVSLEMLTPGSVRDVSAIIATWLIAEGYAQAEMRYVDEDVFSHPNRDSNPNR